MRDRCFRKLLKKKAGKIGTATDSVHYDFVNLICCYGDYDLTLSAGETQVEASGYLYDVNLNIESFYALNDREILNIAYVYGAKLSADGSLLFQPSTNGIDVLDGRLGNLLNRVALSVPLSSNYDALVADGKDNVLVAITGTNGDGIAVVDLTSIPEPPPLPYMRKLGSKSDRVIGGNNSLSDHDIPRSNRPNHRLPVVRRVPHVTKPIWPSGGSR